MVTYGSRAITFAAVMFLALTAISRANVQYTNAPSGKHDNVARVGGASHPCMLAQTSCPPPHDPANFNDCMNYAAAYNQTLWQQYCSYLSSNGIIGSALAQACYAAGPGNINAKKQFCYLAFF